MPALDWWLIGQVIIERSDLAIALKSLSITRGLLLGFAALSHSLGKTRKMKVNSKKVGN